MNCFQASYITRLQEWRELRTRLENCDLQTQCVEVDRWWQQAPVTNHYLHPDFVEEWPNPWDLLVENNYCPLARGLGMAYTLAALGVSKLELVSATDANQESVFLLLVDDAKYIINYWPQTVLNNRLTDFTITKHIKIHNLLKHIQTQ